MPAQVFNLGGRWHSRWCRKLQEHGSERVTNMEWAEELPVCRHCIDLVLAESEYLDSQERLDVLARELRSLGGDPELLANASGGRQ